jgi:hypothetical protein
MSVAAINLHDLLGGIFMEDVVAGDLTRDMRRLDVLEARRLAQSNYLSAPELLFDEVLEVWREHQEAGWDGESAPPISRDAVSNALDIVRLLPLELEKLDVVAENDGSIGFEWRSKDSILAMSFLPNGFYTFAGHFPKRQKLHGSGQFDGMVPSEVWARLEAHFWRN